MTPEQKNFIIELTKAAKTHKEWLTIVKFGLPTLLESPGLLAEIIAAEVFHRGFMKTDAPTEGIYNISGIMFELGIKFTIDEKK